MTLEEWRGLQPGDAVRRVSGYNSSTTFQRGDIGWVVNRVARDVFYPGATPSWRVRHLNGRIIRTSNHTFWEKIHDPT